MNRELITKMVIWNDEMTCCIGFSKQFDETAYQFIQESKRTHIKNTGEGMPEFTAGVFELPKTKEKVYVLEIHQ